MPRALILAGLLLASAAPAAPARAADACDALAARVIRVTGASLAGRAGSGAVFRAQDAERLSLDCRAPARITLASRDREPPRAYFALVGLAARALTGADAAYAETLALTLHQDSLLADAPRRGATGPVLMLCETGPRIDALAGDLTVCRLARTGRGVSPIRSKG
ncbi:hypothetical protein Q8W71_11430 [Methylobacterium sp. NEAU 140]|uniref:hypothetical protein n=1 Tax=Methylobacterium sp. NEAU 140 TaxID=3064945 RepID=UPI002735BA73|nr:hypothetical protein [Methylobacterium sp. NEAU 140]MDP4023239.1 hypothetical protein [Methylobacterium sp. NEAU 140]